MNKFKTGNQLGRFFALLTILLMTRANKEAGTVASQTAESCANPAGCEVINISGKVTSGPTSIHQPEGAITPDYIRVPKAGERCHHSGLTRTGMLELVLPGAGNYNCPPVRSASLRSDAAKRGVRLVQYDSLVSFLKSQSPEHRQEPAKPKQRPAFIRLPANGTFCPHTGLRRSKMMSLIMQRPWNGMKPPVRSVLLVKPAHTAGTRLVDYASLLAYLAAHEEHGQDRIPVKTAA